MNTQNKDTMQFSKRLDFYWKFIAGYAIALLLFVILKGTFQGESSYIIEFKNPIVVLLVIIITASALSAAIAAFKKHSISVGRDYIQLKSRFHTKRYGRDELKRIAIGRQRLNKLNQSIRIIKIKVNGRRRVIKIRPSAFWNEPELVTRIIKLKKNLNL